MDIRLKNGKSEIKFDVKDFYSSEVVRFGNSAKINCQKKYRGRKVIVLVLKD